MAYLGAYGPFTAASGTIQRCDVASDAGGLYVVNTTRFDLALSLEGRQPVTTTQFGGRPWIMVVPAGDRRGLPISVDHFGANGFPGYVWVLPIDNSGSLALSGTKSGNAAFYIEAYADARELPPDFASAQFSNLASQPRIVSIPITAQQVPISGSFIGSNTFLPITLARANSWVSDGVTVHTETIYLYSLLLTLRGVRWLQLQPNLIESGPGGLFTTSPQIGDGVLYSGQPLTQLLSGLLPLAVQMVGNPAQETSGQTYSFILRLMLGAAWPMPGAAINGLIDGTLIYDVDNAGQLPPPSIGNGAATPPGAIY